MQQLVVHKSWSLLLMNKEQYIRNLIYEVNDLCATYQILRIVIAMPLPQGTADCIANAQTISVSDGVQVCWAKYFE